MTINEIAKLAGVSRATVSRYLNEGYVSEEKRERITKVIAETGYIPSVQAQNLRSKKTRLIGVIIPKINSDTVSRMVAGISEVLEKSDYQLLLGNTSNNINEELRLLKIFQENQVDGIIFLATIYTAKHKELLKNNKVPLVVLGQHIKGSSCIYNDDYAGAKAISDILLKNAVRPCYISVTEKDVAVGKNRKNGYIDALKEQKIAYQKEQIAEADFTEASGYQAIQQLYKNCPDMDTLICATDSAAIGTMKYLREIGKKIPEEIQIASIGDTNICQWISPMLTSVHFYYKTCGREAAKMLLEKLEQTHTVNKEMKMGFEVVLRNSHRPLDTF